MIQNFSYLFLGSKLKQFGEKISSQINKILKDYEISFEPRSLWLINILYNDSPVSINSLAEVLNMTHPAIVQMINKLRKEEIVEAEKSEDDKRVTLVKLTTKGADEFERILPLLQDIESVIQSYIEDTGLDGQYLLSNSDRIFDFRTIKNDVEKKYKDRLLKEIKIVPYERKYKKAFKQLNYEWLKKYFEIEKEDKRILSYPEEEIIKKGGEIFFAMLKKEAVGTCAVIRVNANTYELLKMAVKESARGKQVGKKLVLTSIGFAATKKAKKLILLTSKKLFAANRLYKTLGFIEMKKEQDKEYKRELIYMELNME